MDVRTTPRAVRAMVIFVAVEAVAIVAAYLVQLLSAGFGALIAEAIVNAVAAYWLSSSALGERWPRPLAWAAAGILFSFLPVLWLAWRASAGPSAPAVV